MLYWSGKGKNRRDKNSCCVKLKSDRWLTLQRRTMSRGDYESLTAPKSTAEKIEKFREEGGYPSKSQALSAIVNEVEKVKTVHESLAELFEELKRTVESLKARRAVKADHSTKLTYSMIDTLLSVISSILKLVAVQNPTS